jgi:hypothetical protein
MALLCEVHHFDGRCKPLKARRTATCMGTKFVYFRPMGPLGWASVHHLTVKVPSLTVSFFVRDLEMVKSHPVVWGKTYTQYEFIQDGYSIMFRFRPGDQWLVFPYVVA